MSINYSGNKRDSKFKNSTLAITAVGTTQSTATTHIFNQSFFNVVGTCTNAAYGLSLPKRPVLGQKYVVKNNGDHMCSIFAAVLGPASTIDGTVGSTAFVLGNNGSEVTFVAHKSTPLTGDLVDVDWVSFSKGGKSVLSIAGDVTLQNSIHYDTVIKITQSSAFTITLPAPASANNGMHVLCNLAVIGAYTVDIQGGAAGKVSGVVYQDSDTGTQTDHVEGAAKLSIDFDNGCVVSDRVDLLSDGVQWCALGYSSAVDKLTFTA